MRLNPHLREHGAVDLGLLDPASGIPDRVHAPTAQNLLSRIVASPRTETQTSAARVPRSTREREGSRRPAPRWALAGATAAVLTAATVAAPALLAGSSSSAFASYTPVPEAVQPGAAAEQQADCLTSGVDPNGRVTAAVTERRGNFLFTLVATESAFGNCFNLDPSATTSAGEETGAISWGDNSDLSTPAPDGASASWGGAFRTAAGDSFTSASGRFGADVTAVRILPSGQDGVQASTAAGYFTAWWPGKPDRDLSLLLTLRDGSEVQRVLTLS